MRRGIWVLLAGLILAGTPGVGRGASILVVFEESSALTYVVSYLADGDPAGGAVDFDVNHGTSFTFNTALVGVHIDGIFSITYTSLSDGHDWLGVRANEGFLSPGLTAGPLTLGTLSVSTPLAPVAVTPLTNDPNDAIHRLGESNFGDGYCYTVLAGGAGGSGTCEPLAPPPPSGGGGGGGPPPDDTGGGGGGEPPPDEEEPPDLPPPPPPPGNGDQVHPIPEASSVVLFVVGLLVAVAGISRAR